jgi:hypothetical protein
MGAHDYIVRMKATDQTKIEKEWEGIVSDDEHESGGGAYAGNATTMRGRITFYDRKFATENEAREFILDKHQKWSGPVAASFLLPAEPTDRDRARKAKALEHYEGVEAKQFACVQGIVQAFVERSSTFVGCKGCQSKLSHEKLKAKIRLGSERSYPGTTYTEGNLVRTRSFTLPALPVCPLCNASLLSETDQARIAGHAEKVKAERVALDEARKDKPSDKIAWSVGGWAAS